MMDGIINVYKERGFTSHDVVAKLRGILKQKKIGHTGTLDPEAQGVLPVCLGKATKVCDLLTDKEKTYEAVLLLGRTTDTQDATGAILSQSEVSCTPREVQRCIESFVGNIMQVPPMYSALKVNGKKLYELARQGVEVERQARPVTIREIRVEKMELPRVTMTVTCSKGTYIRTLCHDIGAALGCGGCMESLLRTAVGPFVIEDSLTLGQIEALRDEGRVEEVLQATDTVFRKLPALLLTPEGQRFAANGNPLRREWVKRLDDRDGKMEQQNGDDKAKRPQGGDVEAEQQGGDDKAKQPQGGTPAADGQQFRLYRQDGSFMAIYAWREEKHCYWPVKMFL